MSNADGFPIQPPRRPAPALPPHPMEPSGGDDTGHSPYLVQRYETLDTHHPGYYPQFPNPKAWAPADTTALASPQFMRHNQQIQHTQHRPSLSQQLPPNLPHHPYIARRPAHADTRVLDGTTGSSDSGSSGNTNPYINHGSTNHDSIEGIRYTSQIGLTMAVPGLAPPSWPPSQLVYPPSANEPLGWPSEPAPVAYGLDPGHAPATGRQYMVAQPIPPVTPTLTANATVPKQHAWPAFGSNSIVPGSQIPQRNFQHAHLLPSLQHQQQPHPFPALAQTHHFQGWNNGGDDGGDAASAVQNDTHDIAWNLNEDPATTEFRCHLCSKSFRRRSWLKRHLLSHSDFKPHSCPWCQSRHKRRDNLFQHMKTKHPREVLQELYETNSCVDMPDIEQLMPAESSGDDALSGPGPNIRNLVEQGHVRKDRVKTVLNELAMRRNGEDASEL
ncbi:Mot3p LALA0_S02e01442g [Lachancea lanzarotensis]|uniref:LALA0S02e01442g1_1 n=1 Tax=Lachancea lanzarotensis TaxID=1245769 RepID=A0A0C7MLZ4_9SACH|nr:uncharacterized protein LALA0_S02e01442g [Lachancea lanzarotensis]CEP60867.1 LALA0S02e01442g1_1 [Lachancea lanzarotensis]